MISLDTLKRSLLSVSLINLGKIQFLGLVDSYSGVSFTGYMFFMRNSLPRQVGLSSCDLIFSDWVALCSVSLLCDHAPFIIYPPAHLSWTVTYVHISSSWQAAIHTIMDPFGTVALVMQDPNDILSFIDLWGLFRILNISLLISVRSLLYTTQWLIYIWVQTVTSSYAWSCLLFHDDSLLQRL